MGLTYSTLFHFEYTPVKLYSVILREAAKKTIIPPLMARSLRPYPPPPSSLIAIGTFFFSLKIAENGF